MLTTLVTIQRAFPDLSVWNNFRVNVAKTKRECICDAYINMVIDSMTAGFGNKDSFHNIN